MEDKRPEKTRTLKDLSDLASLLPGVPTSAGGIGDAARKPPEHDGKGKSLTIELDMRGRKGKVVTLITGFQHNPQTMETIARILKQHCGAGGTVKSMSIEIQGDQRERVSAKLRDLNYKPKMKGR